MLIMKSIRWVLLLAMLLPASEAQAVEQVSDADEEVLQRARIKTDNASLLTFLRQQADAAEPGKIAQLIRNLDSDRFQTREAAVRRLVEVGPRALPGLRKAKDSKQAEIARRAKDCLNQIYRNRRVSLPLFVTHLLVRRRVEGAVEALLRYLPCEGDEATQEEIWYGLDTLGIREGIVALELVTALSDVRPERRAVAVCIVGRAGNDRQREKVRELLNDADPWVRLRAAQGLLAGKDKSSIAALIALLDDKVPLTLAWQAEELLVWTAGEEAPKVRLGDGTVSARRRCGAEWRAWWRRKCGEWELVKKRRSHAPPRLLLLNSTKGGNCILLCGSDGGERWFVREQNAVKDAQLTASGHLLVVEARDHNNGVVLERDLEGNILRQFALNQPSTCKRLPNGSLFVVEGWAGAKTAREWTAEGGILYEWTLPGEHGCCRVIRIMENGNLFWAGREEEKAGEAKRVEWSIGETDPLTKEEIRLVNLKDRMYSADVFPEGEKSILILEHGFQPLDCYETEEGVILTRRAGPYQPARLKRASEGKTVWQLRLDGIDADDVLPSRRRNTFLITGWMDQMPGVVECTPEGKRIWEVIFDREDSGIGLIHSCLGLVSFGFPWRIEAAHDVDSVEVRIEQMKHHKPNIRKRAIGALHRHGPEAEAAIPLLIEAFDDPLVCEWAQGALTSIGKKGLASIARAIKDKRLNVRVGAVNTLASASERSNSVVPLYAEALRDESELVRLSAARQLGYFGKKAMGAVPALKKALKDKHLDVAAAAALSLGEIGHADRGVVSALLEATRIKDDSLRRDAIAALGKLGAGAASAVPRLVGALSEPELKGCRAAIIEALGEIGPDAKAAVPILVKTVVKRDRETGEQAVEALGKIGPWTKEVVPTLIACLKEEKLRDVAAGALARIGPPAKSAIPALTEARKNSTNARFRYEATKAIRAIRRD
jgi:HEAT repeat protein